jgi:two-component system response regulator (stage 0 sporulation protein F)
VRAQLRAITVPKLLVVEDNENLRLLYEQELTEEGYSVATADSGKEAIACIESKKPDLIIMDIAMPGMDGIQAMHEILHRHRIIPIILNTAFPNYRDDYATWPANAYVMKSGDLTELKQKIQEQLQLFGLT